MALKTCDDPRQQLDVRGNLIIISFNVFIAIFFLGFSVPIQCLSKARKEKPNQLAILTKDLSIYFLAKRFWQKFCSVARLIHWTFFSFLCF